MSSRPAGLEVLLQIHTVLGGPLSWAAHFGVMYWLAPRACLWGVTWPMHGVTAVVVAAIAHALVLGVRKLRLARGITDRRLASRELFLGWVGSAFSVFFLVLTVAEWLPALYLDPCM